MTTYDAQRDIAAEGQRAMIFHGITREDDEALVNDVATAIIHLTCALRRHNMSPPTAIVFDHDTYRRFKMTRLPFDIRGGEPSMTLAGVRLEEEG